MFAWRYKMLNNSHALSNFCSLFYKNSSITINDISRRQLINALNSYKVVVYRDCDLSPESLLVIANMLGAISLHTLTDFHEPNYPEIMLLSNKRLNGKAIGVSDPGRIWHSDSSFLNYPPSYTLLYSLEVPVRGGETLFINMHSAYERLTSSLKSIVDSSQGVFSYRPSYEAKRSKNPERRPLTALEEASLQDVEHPLVWIHPNTGEAALYINETHTVGIIGQSYSEFQKSLEALLDISYAVGPDYVHHWKPGDLIIWDNRSVIHRGTVHDPTENRYIQRISIR